MVSWLDWGSDGGWCGEEAYSWDYGCDEGEVDDYICDYCEVDGAVGEIVGLETAGCFGDLHHGDYRDAFDVCQFHVVYQLWTVTYTNLDMNRVVIVVLALLSILRFHILQATYKARNVSVTMLKVPTENHRPSRRGQFEGELFHGFEGSH